ARKFILPARLQTDGRTVLAQADEGFALAHGLPTEALHAFQQLANAGPAVIGHRLVGLQIVDKFFVLGADTPFGLWPAAFRQLANKIVAVLDRTAGGLRNGHGKTPSARYLSSGHDWRKVPLFLY